jgi:hypothetical protein
LKRYTSSTTHGKENRFHFVTTFGIAEKCPKCPTIVFSSGKDDDNIKMDADDPTFNGRTTMTLVAGQSLLVVGAILAAQILVSVSS